MLLKPGTKIGAETQIELKKGQDVLVRQGVRLVSIQDSAISSEADPVNGTDVTIAGFVHGENRPIALFGDEARLVVTKTGIVEGQADGLFMQGKAIALINHGLIIGYDSIADLQGTGQGPAVRIVNSGTMTGNNGGINIGGAQGSVVINDGRILTLDDTAISGSGGVDRIANAGLIDGDLLLQAGNDVYDGRGGFVRGVVRGEDGNDLFLPGTRKDQLFGGEGFDTLDFRGKAAVRVNLTDASQNTGRAKGDSYDADIEAIRGSDRADNMTGSNIANLLAGRLGNDRLSGDIGADTLEGGKGVDTLAGGAGNDAFRFRNAGDGGDRITDFTRSPFGGLDLIQIDADGFDLNLPLGQLDETRFVLGTSNRAADGDDRFIFRTTDATLWFDRDGSGGKFKPLLLADLDDDAALVFGAAAIELF